MLKGCVARKSWLRIVPCNIALKGLSCHSTQHPIQTSSNIKMTYSATSKRLGIRATYLDTQFENTSEIAPKNRLCKRGLKTGGFFFLLFSGKKGRGGSVGTKERFWTTFGWFGFKNKTPVSLGPHCFYQLSTFYYGMSHHRKNVVEWKKVRSRLRKRNLPGTTLNLKGTSLCLSMHGLI